MRHTQAITGRTQRSEQGFAIFTAIFIMVAMAIMGVGAVALISGGAQQMRDEYQSEQAFQVAQAGRAYVAAQLKSDANWSDNTDIASTAMGPGTFTVHYLTSPPPTATTATVEVTGTVGGISRKIEQALSKGGSRAFQNAVYIGCANPSNPASCPDFSMTGSGSVMINGDTAMGGDLTQTGSGSMNINGDAEMGGGASTTGSATTTINGDASIGNSSLGSGVTVTGTTSTSVPPNTALAIPTPDWTYWENYAKCVGQPGCAYTSVTGNKSFAAGTYGSAASPSNWYVTGRVTMTGSGTVTIYGTVMAIGNVSITGSKNVRINGTLITRGTLSNTGSGSFTNGAGYPAAPNPSIVSQGNVSLTGSGQIALNGWAYSQGRVSLTGSGSLTNTTGGIIAGNGISMTGSGSMSLTYNASYVPVGGFTGGESGSGGEGQYIGFGTWKETF